MRDIIAGELGGPTVFKDRSKKVELARSEIVPSWNQKVEPKAMSGGPMIHKSRRRLAPRAGLEPATP